MFDLFGNCSLLIYHSISHSARNGYPKLLHLNTKKQSHVLPIHICGKTVSIVFGYLLTLNRLKGITFQYGIFSSNVIYKFILHIGMAH